MNISRLIHILTVLAILSGCVTTPRQPIVYNQGAVVNSLSTGISISVHSAEQSMSGSGFMVYRRPDKVHMILLSPFGTTLFEVFALGDRITLVYPSQGVAYTGHFRDLPEKGNTQGWVLMRWVMDADPLGKSKPDGTYDNISSQGVREKITVEQGLITVKSNPAGDHIYYSNYNVINGVPLASEIDIRNKVDDRILLKLQEPEVNIPLEDAAFLPRLEGLKVLPLTAIETL